MEEAPPLPPRSPQLAPAADGSASDSSLPDGGNRAAGVEVVPCDDPVLVEASGEHEEVAVAVAMESDSSVLAAGGEGAKMEVDEENILDLTSSQLHDLTDVDLSPTLAELDLTSNRLSFIDPRIANLSHLQVRDLSFWICI